jgi:glutamate formiminotransferase/formiminotetrahydrofolate cyclodeaminase
MAPGGGSISAYVGALGVSLGTMVANLSANKPGWESKLDYFSELAERGQQTKNELLFLVDEDTRSFNAIIDAIRMPKDTEEEKKNRLESIEKASQYAAEVPFRVMQTSANSIALIEEMIKNGNAASVTDAGVGALCLQTAIQGAYMNVRVNIKDLNDKSFAQNLGAKAEALSLETTKKISELISEVDKKLTA